MIIIRLFQVRIKCKMLSDLWRSKLISGVFSTGLRQAKQWMRNSFCLSHKNFKLLYIRHYENKLNQSNRTYRTFLKNETPADQKSIWVCKKKSLVIIKKFRKRIRKNIYNITYMWMLSNCGAGEDSWESLGQQGDPTSQS